MIQITKLKAMYGNSRPFNLMYTFGPTTGERFFLNIADVCEVAFNSERELDGFIEVLWQHNLARMVAQARPITAERKLYAKDITGNPND